MTATTPDLVLATLEAARGPLEVSELARATDKSETTVRDALKKLVGAGTVNRQNGDGPARFSLPEKKTPRPVRTPYRGTPGNHSAAAQRDEDVLAVIQRIGPVSRSELAIELELDPALVYYSLWRLIRAGSVAKLRDGTRTPKYALPEEVQMDH